MTVGVICALIVFPPLYLAKVLFQKSAVFTKRGSRFDKTIEWAKEKGRFKPAWEAVETDYRPSVVEDRQRGLWPAMAKE
jgi:hypothetical protein